MERFFAATMVLACLVLLARLGLGERRVARLMNGLRRWRARWQGPRPASMFSSSAHKQAERAAQDAIRKARERAAGEWDGNVYKPDSFRKKQGRRDIH